MGKDWKTPGKVAEAQKKGKLFMKIAREVTVATKLGGSNPEGNARLKLALQQARAISCPKDTIERAIKRGSGEADDGVQFELLTYEGYGPHQVGVIVECQTDNKNRTVSEIRNAFQKNGGQLGESGSVAWMFDRTSICCATKQEQCDPEEEAIEAGADDVEPDDEANDSQNEASHKCIFYGRPEDLDNIRVALTGRGWEITAAELGYRPKNYTDLSTEQKAEVFPLLEALEDDDDSHRIYVTLK